MKTGNKEYPAEFYDKIYKGCLEIRRVMPVRKKVIWLTDSTVR